jgi:hypothetical protein
VTYLKIDDNLADHPKIVGLSDGAFRLYVAGLCYSQRHLTDGILPLSQVPKLTPNYRKRHVDELTARLLWAPVAGHGWYEIHDYLQWNDSRETVAKRRANGRANAEKRWRDEGGWIG